jgi:spermidine synthase
VILLCILFSDISRWTEVPNRVYAYSSEYNDIEVFDYGKTRLLSMNGSHSSWLDVEQKKSYFAYINEVTRIIDEEKPKRVLVIWAAWFSLPQDIAKRDFIERVDVCDIDGSLDRIAEEYFLREKLDPKITFSKESARYFIRKKTSENEKYDFIFLDAYNGKISIPSELLTKNFFDTVKAISTKTIVMNAIMDTAKESSFYKKLANTLVASWEQAYIKPVWSSGRGYYDNFILRNNPSLDYTKITTTDDLSLYTDDQNTLEFDKYTLFYQRKYN